MDMLHGPMAKKILLFALPIAALSILQQLFNSVDVAVVGRYVGTGALAAVGTNTPVISLFINCLVSLSVGTTVGISHMIGLQEQDGVDRTENIQKMVHTSILFALLCGTAIMILGIGMSEMILRLMKVPSDVLADAVLYLRIYFLATPAIMVYNFLSAILRSVGDTKRPLYVLLISGLLNVVLNLILVIVFHRGVDGVAIATVVSNLVSAAILWIFLMKEQPLLRLYPRKLGLHKTSLIRVLKIGVPASMQGMFFCLSNMFIQSGVNSLGSAAAAAAAAAQIFINFVFFVVGGFNQAALAFAGQNYGAGEEKRCMRVLTISVGECFVCCMLMIACFMGLRYPLLGLFSADAEVIELAIIQLYITLLAYPLVCCYEVTGAWLRARSHSLEPALVVIVGSVFFRILWLKTVFRFYPTYSVLYLVYPISWVLTITIMTVTAIVLTKKDRRNKAKSIEA